MPAQKNQTDKTAYMELRKAIKEKNIEGIYVLYGDEDYLREYYFRQMKQIICDGSFDEFNYKQFDGKDVDLPALSDAIDSLPVFAEKTFIELRDMELSKCSESRKNQFAEIIRDLPSYCCLVLIYSSGSIGLDKRSSLYSLLKKTAKIVEFTLQNDSDLTKWIYRRFLDAGHEIKRNEAEYLIFLCGGFMTNLISEIEKIAAYSKNTAISKEDIDAVVTPVPDAIVFKMTDAISNQNFDAAAKIMADLLQMREAPIKILSILGGQMRRLYTARLLLELGRGTDEVKRILGLKSDYPARLLMKAASNLTLDWCKNAVRLCVETDFSMKCESIDDDDLLKLVFVRLAAR